MKYTLVEMPPESVTLEEESYVEASSAEELQEKSEVEDSVLQRLFMPGRRVGPYRVVGYVASGGMGDIYAAHRVMDDGRVLGPVALKVIAPELKGDWQIEERFKREAAISKAIRSPRVTRVYEFGESEDGHMFLSMELLKGEELFDRLTTLRRLSPQQACKIFLPVLEGLHAVHESGFIHRDLKPENIFLAQQQGREIVKILDFGIAKRADEPSDPFLSVVGKVYGTPEYISPEQSLSPDVDRRADLYSIGVMLHECLTGVLPFRGATTYETILAQQTQPPPPLPGVDEAFADIVFRAMQKKPRDRYQTAGEMAADLKRWYLNHHDDPFAYDLRNSDSLPSIARNRSGTPQPRRDTPQPKKPAGPQAGEVPNLVPLKREEPEPPTRTTATDDAATDEHALPTLEDQDNRITYVVTALAALIVLAAIGWAFAT